MKAKTIRLVVLALVIMVWASIALAVPHGPEDIIREADEQANFSSIGPTQIDAQAGNITELKINVSIVTTNWQGYYGNVTGTITIDDAQGNTFFDWSSTAFSPTGEIYAANQTIGNWSDITCVNLNGNGTLGHTGINVTQIETMFGMTGTESDGIDETFLQTQNITIDGVLHENCPSLHLYEGNESQTHRWNESLLTINGTGTVIFAAEVEEDQVGFDGTEWDFQMIVPDDGGDTQATPYQFYIELA